MQVQKYRSGIPAGCNDCTVADKTGDLGFVRHDVAIVQYPGGSYTLAIMTNGAPYQILQAKSPRITMHDKFRAYRAGRGMNPPLSS
jgi:beta-lactamase class A